MLSASWFSIWCRVLEGEGHAGAGLSSRTPTDRVYDHHHSAGSVRQTLVHVVGGAPLDDTKSSELITHGCHEELWIHLLLLSAFGC